jgi:hypothetical protein
MASTKWKKYSSLLLDNLNDLLAILLCLVAGFYSLLGGKSADVWLLAAITGALGLIAFGAIKDRQARERLQKLVEGLTKTAKVTDVFKTRSDYRPFEEVIASAQEVCMVGASLVNFLGLHEDHFKNIIMQHGAMIRIVILDEDSAVIESAAQCLDTESGEIREEIARAERIIRSIAIECKTSRGSIELRKMAAFPNYGMTIVDPAKPVGEVMIEFNGYKEETSFRPHVQFSKESDPVWFEHYRKEFERLWKESNDCMVNQRSRISSASNHRR